MTLLQLRYFQALATVLHYTKAAEMLHISQPSLSYAISELEKELGVPLFVRKKHKISITEFGLEFLPYVEKVLALIEEGTEKTRALAGIKESQIKFGYVYSTSGDLIPSILRYMARHEEFSHIKLSMVQEVSRNILQFILDKKIDMGFTMHTAEEVNSVPIFVQPLYLVVPLDHPLAKKKVVKTLDFVHEPVIVLEKGSVLRQVVENIYKAVGAMPNVAIELNECAAALELVVSGMGVSILPNIPAVNTDTVKLIPVADHKELYRRVVYLSWLKDKKLTHAMKQFSDMILQEFAIGDEK